MGGNQFASTSRVPIGALPEILGKIEGVINLEVGPGNYLGSTGRVPESGDVDLGFDGRLRWGTWESRFQRRGYETKRMSVLIGSAQVDFFFGHMPLLQFYCHHPLHSDYKGAHRNWLISALCPDGWHWSGKDGLCQRRNGMTVRSIKDPAGIVGELTGIPDPLLFDSVESILAVVESGGARLSRPADEILSRWRETMAAA